MNYKIFTGLKYNHTISSKYGFARCCIIVWSSELEHPVRLCDGAVVAAVLGDTAEITGEYLVHDKLARVCNRTGIYAYPLINSKATQSVSLLSAAGLWVGLGSSRIGEHAKTYKYRRRS